MTSEPRSFRVILENDTVRVLEFRSGPGLGVCGQGMHYHPERVTVSLTGAKAKIASADGKTVVRDIPVGSRIFLAGGNAHDGKHRRFRHAHLHHRTEGQGLEAEHWLTQRDPIGGSGALIRPGLTLERPCRNFPAAVGAVPTKTNAVA